MLMALGIIALIALLVFLATVLSPAMALDPNERMVLAQEWPVQKRAFSTNTMPGKINSGTGTLEPLTPLAFNTSTNMWTVWSATDGANQKTTVTVDGTSGNVTLSVAYGGAGAETVAVAYSATAAAWEAALETLANVLPGDVTVTGGVGASGGGTPYVVEFGGRLASTPVTFTVTDATLAGGGDTVTVVQTTTGAAGVGKSTIKGFLWPDPATLIADKEILAQIMRAGQLHFADVPVPAGETESALKEAMRVQCHLIGISVQGLDQVR